MSGGGVVTGIGWYRRDQWTRLRRLASDADKLEESYDDWLADAQQLLIQMSIGGVRTQCVDVDLDALIDWCRSEGRPLDGAARAAFVASQLTLAHASTTDAAATGTHISRDIVEATRKKIDTLSENETQSLQQQSGRFQQELTGFVIGFTSELRPEALALGLYVMLVVYEMFRTARSKVRKARDRVVLRHWQAAHNLVNGLQASGLRPADISSGAIETNEPHVLQYLIDTLAEQVEEDSGLSDAEFWRLFAVLKTVVDTLHEMAGATPVAGGER